MTDSLQERLSSLREDDVRISVWRDSEGWMDRELVKERLKKEDEENFVETSDEPEKRYTFSTKDGEVTAWNRYTMPGIEEGVELVVELRNGDIPWTGSEELPVGTGVLDYKPVGANHVAGLEDEKEEILDFLRGIDKDFGLSEQTGIILQGPPGTGKTELVREICKERYGSVPVTVSGPEILSKWVGESERALRSKFEEARNTRHKVLYIDELDAIGRSRDGSSESYSAQVVAQLLVLLDGVEAKTRAESTNADEDEKSLKVIASTNKPDVVDEALRRPGRLGNLPIQFEKPDETEKKAILHHYLEKIRASEDGELGPELEAFVTEGNQIDTVTRLEGEDTEGFTGADIENWVIESVKRLRKEGSDSLDARTLNETLNEILENRERKEDPSPE
jgi:SpoVK/Ycf46/Vps4 family AAA+-type ATPase